MLTTTNLHRVLDLAGALLRVDDYAQVGPAMLAGLVDVVGSDTATLTHLDLHTRREVALFWPSTRAASGTLGAYSAVAHTHPLRGPVGAAMRAGGDPAPVRISDVMSARAWRRTALRTEGLPEVTDQLTLALRGRGPVVHAVSLGRHSGTFTDRQRDLLSRAAPHLRAAVARARPGGALALQLSPEPGWVPVVHAPGLRAPVRTLPEPAPPASATPSGASVSPREREVLVLVADGLTDAAIARRLGIRPKTVSRHLHRVYSRFNVSNRAAAIRLLEATGPRAAPDVPLP